MTPSFYRQRSPNPMLTQTDTFWSTLATATNIGKYISSLAIRCFFTNYDANIAQRKFLVLDLEGVLFYSTIERPEKRYDFFVQYMDGGQRCTHFVTLRPMIREFFASVSEWYEVVLYTTMEKVVAVEMAMRLEEEVPGCHFSRMLYRQDCDYINGKYLKDLKKVSSDMSSVVMLDCEYEPYNNKLPIDPFNGEIKDRSLLSSMIILDCLRYCSDVRSILELAHL
ncbi:CTD nuclear envelope phosphatase 1 [Nematocida homosporus]|uniref:CTD nuclear envelope phosphatase 1 n=1 Tax=Nematocida homosporus TaxID=1912981 RepID=UPI00221E50FA|nr:CTD nuclear envelope phosphatase 1 [Nematocida homosporus]KAI5185515.1 CTD nuclear envelope phosphatase 1 [Nematocida homosporus]